MIDQAAGAIAIAIAACAVHHDAFLLTAPLAASLAWLFYLRRAVFLFLNCTIECRCLITNEVPTNMAL
jgi:hypothetical protein